MIQAGYFRPKKGGKVCNHPMRERRARFGEMRKKTAARTTGLKGAVSAVIRVGAGFAPGRGTLLVFIDDATGRLTQLRCVPTETTLGYMQVLHEHIRVHGVPASLYSDKHSIFRINAKNADPDAETQFSRAARELGIECIHAHSPQAKGRVERANQTLQDRLVKEMRLAGINDMGGANAWLPGYIAEYNRRFAVEPKDPRDVHVPDQDTVDALARTLSVQVTRTLSKNLSCQYENHVLHIKTSGTGRGLRGAKVTVHEHFDGTKELLWQKRKLTDTVMDKPRRQLPVADSKTANARVDHAMVQRTTGHKPAANHPWRKPIGQSPHDGKCATL